MVNFVIGFVIGYLSVNYLLEKDNSVIIRIKKVIESYRNN